MDTLQSPSQVVNYSPFTEEEFKLMETEMKSLGLYLPEDKMGIMWERCRRIRGTNENQPCGCKSASGLWKRCVDDINDFIRSKQ